MKTEKFNKLKNDLIKIDALEAGYEPLTRKSRKGAAKHEA